MLEDSSVFETSIDSGICEDITLPMPADKMASKIKTYQQILVVLERDRLLRAEQRKRLSQLAEKRQRKKRIEEPCNVCCAELNADEIKSCVTCVNCQKKACRGNSCAVWIPSRSGWECQLCNQSQESISKSNEWLHQQITGRYLSPFSARSEPSLLRNYLSSTPDLDRRSEAASSFYGEQREHVREVIEETLAEMLGGSLDNISVNQLNKSREYLDLFCKYHSPLSHKLHRLETSMLLSQSAKDLPTWENGEAPGISHVKLKRFIEKVINDAIRLPSFTNEPITPGPTNDQSLPFFDPKKYQELLATAVLNKIVDSYNYEQKFDSNRDAATDCSDLDNNHNALIGRKVQSGSISSSSIEPESDCSITDPPSNISRLDDFSRRNSNSNPLVDVLSQCDRNNSSRLNDYLTRHNVPLPDFSIESDSSNEDNLSASKHIGNSWEGNWLFKKKRPGHESPASVGMLVPCPKEDIKTQIGDKTADELSDLSEAGSECGDNNIEEIEDATQNPLIQNKNIIGGKSPIGIFDELFEQTSLISSSSLPEGDSVYTETKNEYVLGDDLSHDLGHTNTSFRAEEAINSLVDTQTLRNNLLNSKELEKRPPTKASLEEIPKPKPRSAQKAPVYENTQEIAEAQLSCSSAASSAIALEGACNIRVANEDCPTDPTNHTNTLPADDEESECNVTESMLKKIQCTKASAIQFLVVVSMAPSLAVPAAEANSALAAIQHNAETTEDTSVSEDEINGNTDGVSENSSPSVANMVLQPDIRCIPLPDCSDPENCAEGSGFDVFIPPPVEFSSELLENTTAPGELIEMMKGSAELIEALDLESGTEEAYENRELNCEPMECFTDQKRSENLVNTIVAVQKASKEKEEPPNVKAAEEELLNENKAFESQVLEDSRITEEVTLNASGDTGQTSEPNVCKEELIKSSCDCLMTVGDAAKILSAETESVIKDVANLLETLPGNVQSTRNQSSEVCSQENIFVVQAANQLTAEYTDSTPSDASVETSIVLEIVNSVCPEGNPSALKTLDEESMKIAVEKSSAESDLDFSDMDKEDEEIDIMKRTESNPVKTLESLADSVNTEYPVETDEESNTAEFTLKEELTKDNIENIENANVMEVSKKNNEGPAPQDDLSLQKETATISSNDNSESASSGYTEESSKVEIPSDNGSDTSPTLENDNVIKTETIVETLENTVYPCKHLLEHPEQLVTMEEQLLASPFHEKEMKTVQLLASGGIESYTREIKKIDSEDPLRARREMIENFEREATVLSAPAELIQLSILDPENINILVKNPLFVEEVEDPIIEKVEKKDCLCYENSSPDLEGMEGLKSYLQSEQAITSNTIESTEYPSEDANYVDSTEQTSPNEEFEVVMHASDDGLTRENQHHDLKLKIDDDELVKEVVYEELTTVAKEDHSSDSVVPLARTPLNTKDYGPDYVTRCAVENLDDVDLSSIPVQLKRNSCKEVNNEQKSEKGSNTKEGTSISGDPVRSIRSIEMESSRSLDENRRYRDSTSDPEDQQKVDTFLLMDANEGREISDELCLGQESTDEISSALEVLKEIGTPIEANVPSDAGIEIDQLSSIIKKSVHHLQDSPELNDELPPEFMESKEADFKEALVCETPPPDTFPSTEPEELIITDIVKKSCLTLLDDENPPLDIDQTDMNSMNIDLLESPEAFLKLDSENILTHTLDELSTQEMILTSKSYLPLIVSENSGELLEIPSENYSTESSIIDQDEIINELLETAHIMSAISGVEKDSWDVALATFLEARMGAEATLQDDIPVDQENIIDDSEQPSLGQAKSLNIDILEMTENYNSNNEEPVTEIFQPTAKESLELKIQVPDKIFTEECGVLTSVKSLGSQSQIIDATSELKDILPKDESLDGSAETIIGKNIPESTSFNKDSTSDAGQTTDDSQPQTEEISLAMTTGSISDTLQSNDSTLQETSGESLVGISSKALLEIENANSEQLLAVPDSSKDDKKPEMNLKSSIKFFIDEYHQVLKDETSFVDVKNSESSLLATSSTAATDISLEASDDIKVLSPKMADDELHASSSVANEIKANAEYETEVAALETMDNPETDKQIEKSANEKETNVPTFEKEAAIVKVSDESPRQQKDSEVTLPAESEVKSISDGNAETSPKMFKLTEADVNLSLASADVPSQEDKNVSENSTEALAEELKGADLNAAGCEKSVCRIVSNILDFDSEPTRREDESKAEKIKDREDKLPTETEVETTSYPSSKTSVKTSKDTETNLISCLEDASVPLLEDRLALENQTEGSAEGSNETNLGSKRQNLEVSQQEPITKTIGNILECDSAANLSQEESNAEEDVNGKATLPAETVLQTTTESSAEISQKRFEDAGSNLLLSSEDADICVRNSYENSSSTLTEESKETDVQTKSQILNDFQGEPSMKMNSDILDCGLKGSSEEESKTEEEKDREVTISAETDVETTTSPSAETSQEIVKDTESKLMSSLGDAHASSFEDRNFNEKSNSTSTQESRETYVDAKSQYLNVNVDEQVPKMNSNTLYCVSESERRGEESKTEGGKDKEHTILAETKDETTSSHNTETPQEIIEDTESNLDPSFGDAGVSSFVDSGASINPEDSPKESKETNLDTKGVNVKDIQEEPTTVMISNTLGRGSDAKRSEDESKTDYKTDDEVILPIETGVEATSNPSAEDAKNFEDAESNLLPSLRYACVFSFGGRSVCENPTVTSAEESKETDLDSKTQYFQAIQDESITKNILNCDSEVDRYKKESKAESDEAMLVTIPAGTYSKITSNTTAETSPEILEDAESNLMSSSGDTDASSFEDMIFCQSSTEASTETEEIEDAEDAPETTMISYILDSVSKGNLCEEESRTDKVTLPKETVVEAPFNACTEMFEEAESSSIPALENESATFCGNSCSSESYSAKQDESGTACQNLEVIQQDVVLKTDRSEGQLKVGNYVALFPTNEVLNACEENTIPLKGTSRFSIPGIVDQDVAAVEAVTKTLLDTETRMITLPSEKDITAEVSINAEQINEVLSEGNGTEQQITLPLTSKDRGIPSTENDISEFEASIQDGIVEAKTGVLATSSPVHALHEVMDSAPATVHKSSLEKQNENSEKVSKSSAFTAEHVMSVDENAKIEEISVVTTTKPEETNSPPLPKPNDTSEQNEIEPPTSVALNSMESHIKETDLTKDPTDLLTDVQTDRPLNISITGVNNISDGPSDTSEVQNVTLEKPSTSLDMVDPIIRSMQHAQETLEEILITYELSFPVENVSVDSISDPENDAMTDSVNIEGDNQLVCNVLSEETISPVVSNTDSLELETSIPPAQDLFTSISDIVLPSTEKTITSENQDLATTTETTEQDTCVVSTAISEQGSSVIETSSHEIESNIDKRKTSLRISLEEVSDALEHAICSEANNQEFTPILKNLTPALTPHNSVDDSVLDILENTQNPYTELVGSNINLKMEDFANVTILDPISRESNAESRSSLENGSKSTDDDKNLVVLEAADAESSFPESLKLLSDDSVLILDASIACQGSLCCEKLDESDLCLFTGNFEPTPLAKDNNEPKLTDPIETSAPQFHDSLETINENTEKHPDESIDLNKLTLQQTFETAEVLQTSKEPETTKEDEESGQKLDETNKTDPEFYDVQTFELASRDSCSSGSSFPDSLEMSTETTSPDETILEDDVELIPGVEEGVKNDIGSTVADSSTVTDKESSPACEEITTQLSPESDGMTEPEARLINSDVISPKNLTSYPSEEICYCESTKESEGKAPESSVDKASDIAGDSSKYASADDISNKLEAVHQKVEADRPPVGSGVPDLESDMQDDHPAKHNHLKSVGLSGNVSSTPTTNKEHFTEMCGPIVEPDLGLNETSNNFGNHAKDTTFLREVTILIPQKVTWDVDTSDKNVDSVSTSDQQTESLAVLNVVSTNLENEEKETISLPQETFSISQLIPEEIIVSVKESGVVARIDDLAESPAGLNVTSVTLENEIKEAIPLAKETFSISQTIAGELIVSVGSEVSANDNQPELPVLQTNVEGNTSDNGESEGYNTTGKACLITENQTVTPRGASLTDTHEENRTSSPIDVTRVKQMEEMSVKHKTHVYPSKNKDGIEAQLPSHTTSNEGQSSSAATQPNLHYTTATKSAETNSAPLITETDQDPINKADKSPSGSEEDQVPVILVTKSSLDCLEEQAVEDDRIIEEPFEVSTELVETSVKGSEETENLKNTLSSDSQENVQKLEENLSDVREVLHERKKADVSETSFETTIDSQSLDEFNQESLIMVLASSKISENNVADRTDGNELELSAEHEEPNIMHEHPTQMVQQVESPSKDLVIPQHHDKLLGIELLRKVASYTESISASEQSVLKNNSLEMSMTTKYVTSREQDSVNSNEANMEASQLVPEKEPKEFDVPFKESITNKNPELTSELSHTLDVEGSSLKVVSSSSEDVSTYDTAPSSFSELSNQTPPSSLTIVEEVQDKMSSETNAAFPLDVWSVSQEIQQSYETTTSKDIQKTRLKTKNDDCKPETPTNASVEAALVQLEQQNLNKDRLVSSSSGEQCSVGYFISAPSPVKMAVPCEIVTAPEQIKVYQGRCKQAKLLSPETCGGSLSLEVAEEAIEALEACEEDDPGADFIVSNEDSYDSMQVLEMMASGNGGVQVVEMVDGIFTNPHYAPTDSIPWHSQKDDSEEVESEPTDSFESDPELSVTPPEIALCYMTPHILDSIPEVIEMAESPPYSRSTLVDNTCRPLSDGDNDSPQPKVEENTFPEASNLEEQETKILDTDSITQVDDLSPGDSNSDTTQQAEKHSLYSFDITDVSLSLSTITNTDPHHEDVELSTLPTDTITCIESSSTATTTSGDTVCTAIHSPARKVIVEMTNDDVVDAHKRLDTTPTTSPAKKSYSVSVSLQLTCEPTNNANAQEPTQTHCNTDLNEYSQTATHALPSTSPSHISAAPDGNAKAPSTQQQQTKIGILKHAAFSKPLSDEEDAANTGHLSHYLPGSIAEREHKKWYNAVEMPNNPYSREALKRRLSASSDKPIDIPNINSPLEKATSEDKLSRAGSEDEDVTTATIVDYKRYGRDYYINHAKYASGSSKQKLTTSTSLHGLDTEDEKACDKEATLQSRQALSSSLSSLHRSHSWGDKRSGSVAGGGSTCDIFTARPVRVEESDPILTRATKLEYLSTPDRDFYLLPSEDISSLRSISASEHSLSQAGDSLTPSEDSDTIRVYDLKKQETRLIRDDDDSISSVAAAVKGLSHTSSTRTQPAAHTPTHARPQLSSQRSFRTTVIQRGSTPSAFKFLQPKRRLYDTRRIMSEDTSPVVREEISRTNGSPEKSVIEEDVIPALPSVKALAKVFQASPQDANAVQTNRPKSYSWKSVDVKAKDEPTPTTPPATPIQTTQSTTNGEELTCAEPAKESYPPSYDQTYIPAETPVLPPIPVAVNGTCSATETSEKIPVASESCEPTAPEVETSQPPEAEESAQNLVEEAPQVSVQEQVEESVTTSEKVEETVKEEVQTPKEPSKDSYSPPYDQVYNPIEAASEQRAVEEPIQTATEIKADHSNSLEWKEDNVEIISTPKVDQQITPPSTPALEEQKVPEEAVAQPMIETTSLLVDVNEVPKTEVTASSHEPTVVKQFLDNEKNAAMPPVASVQPQKDKAASIVETKSTSAVEMDASGADNVHETVESTAATEVKAEVAVSAPETAEEAIVPEKSTATEEHSQVLEQMSTEKVESVSEIEAAPAEEPALSAVVVPSATEPISTIEVTSEAEQAHQEVVAAVEPAQSFHEEQVSSSAPIPDESIAPKSSEETTPEVATSPVNGQSADEVKATENGVPTSPTQTSQSEQPKQNGTEPKRSEIRFTQEMPPKDRPISPVLVPGKLKSSIAFFENLKNNK